jgi:hypothetical protein
MDPVLTCFDALALLDLHLNPARQNASGGVNIDVQTLPPHKTRISRTGSHQQTSRHCIN